MAEGRTTFDLLLRAGRLVTPSGDRPGVVAIQGDRIAAVEAALRVAAETTLNFPDAVVLPGLIDLHAHPACAGSRFGVDPDRECLPHGVTTVLSQGDAGAANWPDYRDTTIRAVRTRVRLAINLAAPGEVAAEGCFATLDNCDVAACIRAIETDEAGLIWGIAVNVSHHSCGTTEPREVLRRGLTVARHTGRPLLFGMRRPQDWSFAEQLDQLRPGDVVTYCYRREPHCIIENGQVHPAIRAARSRGVLFDVGHGMASFDFATAERALGEGFPPDTISTDLQARHRGATPPHTLPLVMSKLRAAGMTEADVFAAVTRTPSRILGLGAEIGQLTAGACADVTVLEWNSEPRPLVDAHGETRLGGAWTPLLTVRGGQLIPSRSA